MLHSNRKLNPKKGYIEIVSDILRNSEFKKLAEFHQHLGTSRLLHSIHVSYITWKIASFFKLDTKSAARAGLLHDFCLYDFHGENVPHRFQLVYHPFAAARMSSTQFELSEKECNAIESHMFPLGPIPTSREGWLITAADKICAVSEFAIGIATVLRTFYFMYRPLLNRI